MTVEGQSAMMGGQSWPGSHVCDDGAEIVRDENPFLSGHRL